MLASSLPLLMFAALALLLFSGFPVAFVLGGLALAFGFLGIFDLCADSGSTLRVH